MPEHFTLIPTGVRANASVFNAALMQLDNTLSALVSAIGTVATLPPYLANGNGRRMVNGSMTAGSNILTVPGAEFASSHRYQNAAVWGAGVNGIGLASSIQSIVDDDHVALAHAAEYDITNKPVAWGPPNGNALNAALLALDAVDGGILFLPPGFYVVDLAVNLKSRITIQGAGKGCTFVAMVGNQNLFRNGSGAGGREHIEIRNLTMLDYGSGWTDNHQLIRITSGDLSTDFALMDCGLVSDVRTMVLENCQRVHIGRCVLEPMTNGLCNLNISQSEPTHGTPSASRDIRIFDNTVKAAGIGRGDAFMDTGDVSSPVNEWFRDQATFNMQVRDAWIAFNRLEGIVSWGLYIEGQKNDNVTLLENTVIASPNFPDADSLGQFAGIYVKGSSGAHIMSNHVFGSDTSKADPNNRGAIGILVQPGSTEPTVTTLDKLEVAYNDVHKFRYGAQFGDTNTQPRLGNFNHHHNHYYDSGDIHVYFLLDRLDTSNGMIVDSHHNKYELSTVGSNVEVRVALGAGVNLNAEDETFIRSNDGYFISSDPAASLGSIYTRNVRNLTGNQAWKTSSLNTYDGVFKSGEVKTLGPSAALDLSAGASTVKVGNLPLGRCAVIRGRFTYTETTDATAARTITVKLNNSITLLTYTTELSKAINYTAEVSFSYAGWTDADTATLLGGVITATCNGGGGPGLIEVEVEIMLN